MSVATVTSKGQITIPKVVRDSLELNPGDKVNFFVNDSGEVIFLPAKKEITSLKGIVPKPDRPVTLEEMKKIIKTRGGVL